MVGPCVYMHFVRPKSRTRVDVTARNQVRTSYGHLQLSRPTSLGAHMHPCLFYKILVFRLFWTPFSRGRQVEIYIQYRLGGHAALPTNLIHTLMQLLLLGSGPTSPPPLPHYVTQTAAASQAVQDRQRLPPWPLPPLLETKTHRHKDNVG